MCRAFRNLPLEKKRVVFSYGLKDTETKKVFLQKPPVVYCTWSWKGVAAEKEVEEAEEEVGEEEEAEEEVGEERARAEMQS